MKTILIAAALAAAFAAAPAPAQSGETITVRVADLDLGTAEGRSTLDLRLVHAARALCGTPSSADPHGKAALDACVSDARAAAAAQRDAIIALALRQGPQALASR
jgi:UrcA family protein